MRLMIKKRFIITTSLVLSTFLLSPLLLANTQAAELYIDEQTVTLDEMVNDDLIVSGNQITINDDVSGDCIATGAQIDINDDIYGDAIVAGGMIRITGDVRGNLIGAGGQITIDGNVSGDVLATGGTITLNGNVGDDVRIGGGSVNINSETIGDDLYVGAGSGGVSEETEVSGETNTQFGEGFQISLPSLSNLQKTARKGIFRIIMNLLRKVGVLLGWLLIGYLLFKFAPVKSRRITDILTDKQKTVRSLIIGLISVFSIVFILPLLILLMFIGIGVPIFQLSASIFSLLITIGGIYSSTAIARMLIKLKKKKYKKYIIPMLIGVSIYQILGWIPLVFCCLGPTIKFIITTWGIGGILLLKWEMIQASKSK